MTTEELAALISAVRAEIKAQMQRDRSPWFSDGEAARYLRVSPKWIAQHRAELRPRLCGKRWRYHREALDRALRSPWMGGGK